MNRLSFHLAIEVLLISSLPTSQARQNSLVICFNLVIEVLLISSQINIPRSLVWVPEFQSRNRGSFGFKMNIVGNCKVREKQFPSRNRGSFNFKPKSTLHTAMSATQFPSRNRGSFNFKQMLQIT